MRFATIRAGNSGLQLSVIALDAPQPLLANVNRWRGQLELPPMSQDELADEMTEVQIGDSTAMLFALQGGASPPSLSSQATSSTPGSAASRSEPATNCIAKPRSRLHVRAAGRLATGSMGTDAEIGV